MLPLPQHFINNCSQLLMIELVAKVYVQLRKVFSKLIKELLGATDFLLLNTTQIGRRVNPFCLNNDIQLLATVSFLDHIHKVGTIRVVCDCWNGNTLTRDLTKHYNFINIRCLQIYLLQVAVVRIGII